MELNLISIKQDELGAAAIFLYKRVKFRSKIEFFPEQKVLARLLPLTRLHPTRSRRIYSQDRDIYVEDTACTNLTV